jgi:hypothetical protein
MSAAALATAGALEPGAGPALTRVSVLPQVRRPHPLLWLMSGRRIRSCGLAATWPFLSNSCLETGGGQAGGQAGGERDAAS